MGNGNTKPADAKADRMRDEFEQNQKLLEQAIRDIRQSGDWEEDSAVTHITAEPGAVVNVGATGKHQAVKPTSDPPSSSFPAKVAKPVTSILGAVKGWPQVAALAVIVIGFVAWLVLRR
jgi:hypothetical protein